MAITYKSQGAGVATETSGAACSPLCPATVDAGDILIAHAYFEGVVDTPDTPAGWTLLDGPQNIGTGGGAARHWVYGKIADGTEDGAAVAFGSQAITSMRAGRVYSFAGRVSGTITELVNGFAFTVHNTDPQMPTVTTTVAGALAIALVGQNDNNAQASPTGETGGDWVEAVAEFTAALTPGLALAIETCTPTADPGTVSGGAISTANDPCGVIGFQMLFEPETALVEIDSTETIGVGSTETPDRLLAVLDPVDTLAVPLTETPDRLSVEFETADSLRMGVDEVALLLAQLDSEIETGVVGLTDAALVDLLLSGDDTGAVGLTEGGTDALLSVFDAEAVRVALSEQADSVAVRLEAGETLPIGLAEALESLAVTLTDAEALALVLGESLVIDVYTDAGETIPVTLALEIEALVAILDAADTVRVGAGSYGEAEESQGGGGGSLRYIVQLSWPRQHEQHGGPP